MLHDVIFSWKFWKKNNLEAASLNAPVSLLSNEAIEETIKLYGRGLKWVY